MNHTFYRIHQIIGDRRTNTPALLPISRATFYRAVARGRIARPVRLSERCVAWRAEDIAQYLEAVNSKREGTT